MTKRKADTALALLREALKMKTNGEIGCSYADGKHGPLCKDDCRACGDTRIKRRIRRYLSSKRRK